MIIRRSRAVILNLKTSANLSVEDNYRICHFQAAERVFVLEIKLFCWQINATKLK